MELSAEEKIRYSRHLTLSQFGLKSQQKLKEAKVLVVGTGGLGAPLLQYLTAVGIGKMGVVDFDTIESSNLQRQILFGDIDVGKKKTTIAIQRLKQQNPGVEFVEYNEMLTSSNAREIIRQYDLVADGTDNFPTRYLVNDACVLEGKPNVYGSIFQFEGQVSVFNYRDGPNYRDLFPHPPPPGMVPSCAEGGVLGVLPGIIGSMQASEVIKVLTGIGRPLSGSLFLFDALNFSTQTVNFKKNPLNPLNGTHPPITELIDYDEFCGLNKHSETKAIDVDELRNWRASQNEFVLVDVREEYEFEAANLNGVSVPLSDLENQLSSIPKTGKTVIHCKSGARSAQAIKLLKSKYGYSNLINLEGGILAWKEKFDPKMFVI